MKKTPAYYLRMAELDPKNAEIYLEAAKAIEERDAVQSDVEFYKAKRDELDKRTEDARGLVEEANKPVPQALLDWYVKPIATKTLGVLPMVGGGALMATGNPLASAAGMGLLGADIYTGLGSNMQAKAEAARLGMEQPEWQDPTGAQRLEGLAMMGLPVVGKVFGKGAAAASGIGLGTVFARSKVNEVGEQMARGGFLEPGADADWSNPDVLTQALVGPQIDKIGLPGSVVPSMLPDAQMALHGVRAATEAPTVVKAARAVGAGGMFDALNRQLPTFEKLGISPLSKRSGVLDYERDIRRHGVLNKMRAKIKSERVKADPKNENDMNGFLGRTPAEGEPGHQEMLEVDRAAIRESWENKHPLQLSDDAVADPRQFKNLRDYRNAVVEHELEHIRGKGETTFQPGAEPWSRSGRRPRPRVNLIDPNRPDAPVVARPPMDRPEGEDDPVYRKETEADKANKSIMARFKARRAANEQAARDRFKAEELLDAERLAKRAESAEYLYEVSAKARAREKAERAANREEDAYFNKIGDRSAERRDASDLTDQLSGETPVKEWEFAKDNEKKDEGVTPRISRLWSKDIKLSVEKFDKEADSKLRTRPPYPKDAVTIVRMRPGEKREGVFDGHRYKDKTILNAQPGEKGALGNPYVADDVAIPAPELAKIKSDPERSKFFFNEKTGKRYTREEAVDKFRDLFYDRMNSVPAKAGKHASFRNWIESLRGKAIGYYKPREKHHHLKVINEWFRDRTPEEKTAAREEAKSRRWNGIMRRKYLRQQLKERNEDPRFVRQKPAKPVEDNSVSRFIQRAIEGKETIDDLPNDYATLKEIAKRTGLGEIPYIGMEDAQKSSSIKERILAAVADMTPKQIRDAFKTDDSPKATHTVYLPFNKKGDFPKDGIDLLAQHLRDGGNAALTTSQHHRRVFDKLTWDAEKREPVFDKQFTVVHDPEFQLPKGSKMRYLPLDQVILTRKTPFDNEPFRNLGELVDSLEKAGIAKPQGSYVPKEAVRIARKLARRYADDQIIGEDVTGHQWTPNRHYTDPEVARAVVMKEKLVERIKELDRVEKDYIDADNKKWGDTKYGEWMRTKHSPLWHEIALEAVQARPQMDKTLSMEHTYIKGAKVNENAALDRFIRKYGKELRAIKNELDIRQEFVRVTGCTPEEAGFYVEEGVVKAMGEGLWSVEEMREEIKARHPRYSRKTNSKGYRNISADDSLPDDAALTAEFGTDYKPETSEVEGIIPKSDKTEPLKSASFWYSVIKQGKEHALTPEALSKRLHMPEQLTKKLLDIVTDETKDPQTRVDRLVDQFVRKWDFAKDNKKDKQSFGAWAFIKGVEAASAAATTLMSMLSGREFISTALDKAVDVVSKLSPGRETRLFKWSEDQGLETSKKDRSLLHNAWLAIKRNLEPSEAKQYLNSFATGDNVRYEVCLVGIRNAVKNCISSAVDRSRAVDEMVRRTNVLTLREKLNANDEAVINFGKYMADREAIASAKHLNADQRAFLKAGADLHDGVMGFMQKLDPNWKARHNYVSQLLRDFDPELIEQVQELSTAERMSIGEYFKREWFKPLNPDGDVPSTLWLKHENTIVRAISKYAAKVRKAIMDDPRNAPSEAEKIMMDNPEYERSIEGSIKQILEYKLNQLLGTEMPESSVYDLLNKGTHGPAALFERKILGYGDMQETHADILVRRLVQAAHKNYPYHDLYRIMGVFSDVNSAPVELREAINAALPDGFGRVSRWANSSIRNSFLSGLSGDIRKPTAFSKGTDWLMGTTTSYDPHPNNAAAHYWFSVISRNLLTRPKFFLINATDPIIKTAIDGDIGEWSNAIMRIYPTVIKGKVAEWITGRKDPLLAEAVNHIRAKGNVAAELSGIMQPSEKGAIFGNKAAKLWGIGKKTQKLWAFLSGQTEHQEHFNTASIWLIEAEKILQRQVENPTRLVEKYGSLVRAAIEGDVKADIWNHVKREATTLAEQRQGVGSDFLGKSELMENMTASMGKNSPAMAAMVFTRMFQNYPATIIAQLAKATDRQLGHLRTRLDKADTTSLSSIIKHTNALGMTDNAVLRAFSPTMLMMAACLMTYQGGRMILTGQMMPTDFKEKDKKGKHKSRLEHFKALISEAGRVATKDLSIGQMLVPVSMIKNTASLLYDPMAGAKGWADMLVPPFFAAQSVMDNVETGKKTYQNFFGPKDEGKRKSKKNS